MVSVTLSLWGVLPIFLKLALDYYSAGTIVWFRFAFSFLILFWFLFLFRSGSIRRISIGSELFWHDSRDSF